MLVDDRAHVDFLIALLDEVAARFGQVLAVFYQPLDVAVFDVNRDGRVDFVLPNFGGSSMSYAEQIGLNSFSINTFSTNITSPNRLAAADFNRDGRTDVILALNGGSLVIAKNTGMSGSSAFVTTATFSITGQLMGIVTGDFNRDGETDVAVARFGTDDVTIRFGKK